jgi:mono/diheme cytochrome c family protein
VKREHAQPARLWSVLLVAIAAAGCDNRQAFHTPEPGLERMLQQRRGDRYGASSFFADGRVMRTPPPFSVAREQPAVGDRRIETGRDAEGYAKKLPVPMTRVLLEQGHVAFDRVCATCHGVLGDGVSVVAEKMELRRPPSLHEARIRDLAPGRVFEIVSVGYGLMPSLAALLDVDERWAVIAYLDALRLSQAAPVAALPATVKADLFREAP